MADEDNDYIDLDEEEGKTKKKKGEGDKSGAGRGRDAAQVSEAAHELMQSLGVSAAQVKEILRSWRHLDSKEVAVRLAEFGKDMAKVSVHAIVSFVDSGYAVLTHFLKQCKNLADLAKKMSPENRKKIQQKHDVNLG
jgi:hypothetical protein